MTKIKISYNLGRSYLPTCAEIKTAVSEPSAVVVQIKNKPEIRQQIGYLTYVKVRTRTLKLPAKHPVVFAAKCRANNGAKMLEILYFPHYLRANKNFKYKFDDRLFRECTQTEHTRHMSQLQ